MLEWGCIFNIFTLITKRKLHWAYRLSIYIIIVVKYHWMSKYYFPIGKGQKSSLVVTMIIWHCGVMQQDFILFLYQIQYFVSSKWLSLSSSLKRKKKKMGATLITSKRRKMKDERIHRTLRNRGHTKQIWRFSSHGWWPWLLHW